MRMSMFGSGSGMDVQMRDRESGIWISGLVSSHAESILQQNCG